MDASCGTLGADALVDELVGTLAGSAQRVKATKAQRKARQRLAEGERLRTLLKEHLGAVGSGAASAQRLAEAKLTVHEIWVGIFQVEHANPAFDEVWALTWDLERLLDPSVESKTRRKKKKR